MTVEKQKNPLESARLAVEYLAAGLSELEITITRLENAGKPRSLRLDDSAGDIAQALAWIREYLDAAEGPTDQSATTVG